ncbi:MAG TPA: tetratricopeptide repeat protein [Terriglobia bacterium]|nr:tetratricopeptide repeat protein [Terriglobia bacterium]
MRSVAQVVIAGAVVLGLAASARAQDQGRDQTGNRARDGSADSSSRDNATGDSDAAPYVPPAASKSVEVGDFYFIKKQYQGALSRYREAVQTDPDYAPAYLGLGKTYDKIGLKQKALTAYQKYLDLLPSEKQADEAKKVHVAIARLERSLKRSSARAGSSKQ